MTSVASLLEPDSNPALYAVSVLTLYVDLPDTPSRTNTQDQRQARTWFDRGVPLKVVETARLKKSCRSCERIVQPPAPTRPIRRGMFGERLRLAPQDVLFVFNEVNPNLPRFPAASIERDASADS